MNMKSGLLILLLSVLFSCSESFTEKEVLGTYTPIGYEKCYDTIILQNNERYERRVYDLNKKMLLSLESKYELRENGSQIYFHSYFMNLDSDLVKFPELVSDTLGGALLNLEMNNGKLEFCTGYYSASLSNQNCYQKER